jgi:hypothetical protein
MWLRRDTFCHLRMPTRSASTSQMHGSYLVDSTPEWLRYPAPVERVRKPFACLVTPNSCATTYLPIYPRLLDG